MRRRSEGTDQGEVITSLLRPAGRKRLGSTQMCERESEEGDARPRSRPGPPSLQTRPPDLRHMQPCLPSVPRPARFPFLQNVHAGCGIGGSEEQAGIYIILQNEDLAKIGSNTYCRPFWPPITQKTLFSIAAESTHQVHSCVTSVEALWKMTNRRRPRCTRGEGTDREEGGQQ